MKNIYKKHKITILVSTLVLTNIVSFLIGNKLSTKGIFFTSVPSKVSDSMKLSDDLKKYESLFLVRKTLLERYAGDIDDNKLLEGAMKGLTQALEDPYTVYLNSREFDNLLKESKASLEGIGVQVAPINGKITILGCMDNSPAQRSGLKSGDVITSINGNVYDGESYYDATDYLQDPKNTDFTITIDREGSDSFSVELKKEHIEKKILESDMLSEDIGYIRLYTFMNENTTEDFKNEINTLKSKGMKGLVLDLRDNPGGLLTEAVGIVSQFIPKDKIITYTLDKYENRVDSKSIGGIAEGMPLVIISNNGSASASEVTIGALKDYGVAISVGETTFGKGIVQQPFKFNNNLGGMKITIAKYYTPNGNNINKIGIEPDVKVESNIKLTDPNYSRENDNQILKAIEKLKERM